MKGIGTILNVSTVLLGSIIGVFLKGGIPERLEKTIMSAVSLAVIIIGLSGTLSEMFTVSEKGVVSANNILLLIISLVIGGIIGELLDIEDVIKKPVRSLSLGQRMRGEIVASLLHNPKLLFLDEPTIGELLDIEDKIEKIGVFFKRKVKFLSKNNPKFVDGFVSSSLIFCVGAMAVVGSISDGLTGNYTTLAAKSVLDGTTSLVLSASFGSGVILSSLTVGVYQGAITLMAGLLKPIMTEVIVSQMSMVGSVLILGIGINMLFEKKYVKTGNLLPAIFIPVIYNLILNIF